MNKAEKKALKAIIKVLDEQKSALDDLMNNTKDVDDGTELERAGDFVQEGIGICEDLVGEAPPT